MQSTGVNWHAIEAAQAIEMAGGTSAGLDDAEAGRRRVRYGLNVLPARKPPSLVALALRQFLSPLIYILVAAGVLAAVLGDTADAVFIAVVVLLDVALGAFQEWKAEQHATALQQLLKTQAVTRRHGVSRRIDAEQLVPGDLVLLESGNRVPADIRLLQVNGLRIDEALLTGESLPVTKQSQPVGTDCAVSERTNMAFAGTLVMAGRAEGLVVATGLRTEVGVIAQSVATTGSGKAPLAVRMERLARQASLAVMGAALLLALVAMVQGMPVREVFFYAVALAVSAIPEGLPVAITVALSVATTRMARRHVIVRRLTAVEGLGSCTFIASDKTGTLTVNQQAVRRLVLPDGITLQVSGAAYTGEGEVTRADGEPLDSETHDRLMQMASIGARCNEATLTLLEGQWVHHGDAVDVALLALAFKAGVDPVTQRAGADTLTVLPYESEQGYAAVFHRGDGGVAVAAKGAPEVILPRCSHVQHGSALVPMDRPLVAEQAWQLASAGYRVLALARGDVAPRDPHALGPHDVHALTLVGLVGMIDPPRPEVRGAVEQCRAAGIEVAMVTGDHPSTALTVARELGIANHEAQVVTGATLQAIERTGGDVADLVRDARVFARVSPTQKLQVVEALKRAGHLVAVTGDGVNDAPALRAAHIGVAMGSGADVARDTASLVLTDDNFASIEAGVEEGRWAYDNIRKVTYLLVATGAAEVLLFLAALLARLPVPLLPVQLLWLNIVTNGIQDVALAFERGESGAMQRPPRRPTEGIFDRLMIAQTVTAGMTMALILLVNWIVLLRLGLPEPEARNRLLLLTVLLQNYHVFNARSETRSAFAVPVSGNYLLVASVLLAQAVHLVAMHVPVMQRVLQVAPVTAQEWAVPFVLSGIIIIVMEAFKRAWRLWSPGHRGA